MLDRSKGVDAVGKYITQGLFLEIGYGDNAVYTLKEIDYTYHGVVYPSLKRLYLDFNDPTEFLFAQEYLLGWKHWQRLIENKVVRKHIDEWRFELDLQIRARAVKEALTLSKDGNFNATKWLSDRGWINKGPGRPSKADILKEAQLQSAITSEYEDDVVRMFQQKQG
jgi:hypothetical protein